MHDIEKMKERVCERLYLAIEERGIERMDVNEVGKLADIVKDLAQAMESCAEAEYYGKISEAMGNPQGTPTADISSPEYEEAMENIKTTLNSVSPFEKQKMMRELRSLVR